MTLAPRPPYARPSHPDGHVGLPTHLSHRVRFRHPGYLDHCNILMVLPALDHQEGGIHHETARIACAILAGNKWEGFFKESRGGSRVTLGPDAILTGNNYYFYVSEELPDDKYPIVPSFAHWRFPHQNLPPSWAAYVIPDIPEDRTLPRVGSLTEALLPRDISCRVTNHIEGTEHAHLIPRSEGQWFIGNQMSDYTNPPRLGTDPIDDPCNAILLRSDIHTIFDQKRFLLVPKASRFVVHIIAPGQNLQLTQLYHNVALQPLVGVALELVFARFAWTVLGLQDNFLRQGVARTLVVVGADSTGEAKEFSGEECRQFVSIRSGSRTQSPLKRQRGVGDSTPQDECSRSPSRGRSRKRIFHDRPMSFNSRFSEGLWTSDGEPSTQTDDCSGEESLC